VRAPSPGARWPRRRDAKEPELAAGGVDVKADALTGRAKAYARLKVLSRIHFKRMSNGCLEYPPRGARLGTWAPA